MLRLNSCHHLTHTLRLFINQLRIEIRIQYTIPSINPKSSVELKFAFELEMFFKILIFSLCLNAVLCWYNGAPPETCETLIPGHGGPFGDTIPADILIERQLISAGELISVSIRSRNDTIFGPFMFRGFMMQARIFDTNMNVPGRVTGSFEQLPSDTRYVPCPTLAPNSVVTHSINHDRSYLQLLWRAPTNIVGNSITVQFYYTIVMNVGIFWHSVTDSIVIQNPARVQNP